MRKLVYLDGQQVVLYRSRMNPSLGRNFEALDPLEWLARMSDHIPRPGARARTPWRPRGIAYRFGCIVIGSRGRSIPSDAARRTH